MTDETEDTPQDITETEPAEEPVAADPAMPTSVEGLQALIDAAVEKAAADKGVQDAPTAPKIPQLDHPPETPEEVQALADAFAQFRKEVADLRNELKAARSPQKFLAAVTETLEDRTKARLQEIAQHSHYCPGCGLLYDYQQQCKGTIEGPHKPMEVVSTNELAGDPAQHTAAPSTDVLAA